MKRCILHVGMNKTGSTSIQATLQRLREQGRFFSPGSQPSGNHGVLLYSMYAPDAEDYPARKALGPDAYDLDEFNARAREEIEALVEQADKAPVVLSGEDVCRLTPEAFATLWEDLNAWLDQVDVYAYVRSPRALITSAYQQRYKNRLVPVGEEYVLQTKLRYNISFAKMDAICGEGVLQLRPYHPAGFLNRCVVQDFFDWVGIPLQAHEVINENQGLSLPAIQMLHAHRRYGRAIAKGRAGERVFRVLVRQLQKLPGPKFALPDALVERALAGQADDIVWMEQRLGEPLQDVTSGSAQVTSLDDLEQVSLDSVELMLDLWRRAYGRHFPTMLVGPLWEDPGCVASCIDTVGLALSELKPAMHPVKRW